LIVLAAVYVSIRLLPFGKWILFAVALIPMFVAASVSMSADAVTFAITILFIALVLRLAFTGSKPSIKNALPLIALALTVGLVKQAHIPILLLLVLLPMCNQNYRNKKIFAILIATGLGAFSLFIFWYMKTSGIVINFDPSIQPELQKQFVLHNPIEFAKILIRTYFTNNSNGFIIGMFGNFGWLTVTLPMLFIILSASLLILSTGIRNKGELIMKDLLRDIKKSVWFRVALIGTFVLVTVIVSAALYLYWTPYQFGSVLGIQGRYFLPILPLLLIPFINQKNTNNDTRKTIIILGSILILFVAIMISIGRFYTD
jgi:uncharacterized membrane protein